MMFDLMPFGRNEKNLFDYLDHFEKNFFGDDLNTFSQFRTDILDKGDHFELQAELPGFQKEDIHIAINGDMLTIHAEHNTKHEEKNGQYVRRERKFGSFSRSFDISNIVADGISAEYKDGVLALHLPKREEPKALTRKIEIM
jgi:HSP20 family protein